MQVVFVEWLDASGLSSTQSLPAARREGLSLMRSVGVLIGEDDQVLRLARDCWTFDDDGTPQDYCRALCVIPKNAIQRRRQWDTAPEPVAPDTTSEASGSLDQCRDEIVTPWL